MCDPRFSGGTGAAVATEIGALAGQVDLAVHAIETSMFKGRRINAKLEQALDQQGLSLDWNAAVIRADTIVFHNPSCLKFDSGIHTRFSCDDMFVVTHENFLRPGGSEAFDVGRCLSILDRATICRNRALAPVSRYNRAGVEQWLARCGSDWRLADFDWFNILDLDLLPPTSNPRDRRGRHSRPGLEKFPPIEEMLIHFPQHAESCVILGADNLLLDPDSLPKHWHVCRFGEQEVTAFLEQIDFFVYYTHPLWRESFGRVIAEAISAGKVVITDAGTASSFGSAVISADGRDVDAIIQAFIADPARYRAFVRDAQASLRRFGTEAFSRTIRTRIRHKTTQAEDVFL